MQIHNSIKRAIGGILMNVNLELVMIMTTKVTQRQPLKGSHAAQRTRLPTAGIHHLPSLDLNW